MLTHATRNRLVYAQRLLQLIIHFWSHLTGSSRVIAARNNYIHVYRKKGKSKKVKSKGKFLYSAVSSPQDRSERQWLRGRASDSRL